MCVLIRVSEKKNARGDYLGHSWKPTHYMTRDFELVRQILMLAEEGGKRYEFEKIYKGDVNV